MADIEKSLPNVKTSITVNPEEEIEIAEQKEIEASKTVEQPKATKKSCGCC